MLVLYGHPFSSYTWKALIPLYANETPFTFRTLEGASVRVADFVAAASPQGKFPVLDDNGTVIFEATAIIEYLDAMHPGHHKLIPAEPTKAVQVRMLDRVFDNHVMNVMQGVVEEYLGNPENPDMARIDAIKARIRRSYDWLERWMATYDVPDGITLIECAAAPSLFYSDWIERIEPDRWPRLAGWRAHLLALPPVARCVEDARPWRHYFPPGAPDRD